MEKVCWRWEGVVDVVEGKGTRASSWVVELEKEEEEEMEEDDVEDHVIMVFALIPN